MGLLLFVLNFLSAIAVFKLSELDNMPGWLSYALFMVGVVNLIVCVLIVLDTLFR